MNNKNIGAHSLRTHWFREILRSSQKNLFKSTGHRFLFLESSPMLSVLGVTSALFLAVAIVESKQAWASPIWLNWTDNSDNEEGFEIERRTEFTEFATIAVVGPNVTSYSDTTVLSGSKY